MSAGGWYLAMAVVTALAGAACGSAGEETRPPAETKEAPEQAEVPAADLEIVGTASFEFVPSDVEAAAGTISVALTSEGGPHTFTLELEGGNETVAQVFSPGETDVGEVELEAGTYSFVCVIPGHLEEGMEGTLTVA